MQTRSTARSSAAPRPVASSRTSAPSARQPSEQRVGHRRRLLVDLLGHEVVEAPLTGGGHVPVDGQGRRLAGAPSSVVTRMAPGPELGQLVVLEGEQRRVEPEQGRDVRGQDTPRPSPTPTMSGEILRAATTRSGSSAWTAATAKEPRTAPVHDAGPPDGLEPSAISASIR